MRTALLISGNPRFSLNFDSQLFNLRDSNIDWYISFWKRNSGDDIKISPNWYEIDTTEKVKKVLEPLLPKGHRLIDVDFLDPLDYPMPFEFNYFQQPPIQVWQQYSILKHCDQKRQSSGISYDLVIRSRSDIGLETPLYLSECLSYLKYYTRNILTPINFRYGCCPAVPDLCDQFAVGLADSMSAYTRSIDLFEQLYLSGVPFQPETLLLHSMKQQGLINVPSLFISLITTRYGHPLEHGHWANVHVLSES
jgi:hypothetical protein